MYNISDTTPLIWRIIHGIAVTKKKLAESRDRMRGHQNTCQCFEVSASFYHLSMSPRLVTRLCISASGGSSLPGLPARSVLSWKCWPLSLQPKFSYFWTKIMFASLPGTRSGCKHRDAPPGDYFNGILNTELPDLSLNAPNISHVTHQSKCRDLRTLIEKVFRFFFTNKPLTLKMWLPFRIVRFY